MNNTYHTLVQMFGNTNAKEVIRVKGTGLCPRGAVGSTLSELSFEIDKEVGH